MHLYIRELPPPPSRDRDPALEPATPNSGRDTIEDLADDFGTDARPDPDVSFLIDLYV
jgi:hypothetical protein